MNNFSAPPLPEIADLAAGRDFLSRVTWINPKVAHHQISRFLESLLATPPAPSDFFILLEEARQPIAAVQEELARRYQDKPLVLGEVEETAFQQVLTIWDKLECAYASCIDLEDAEAPEAGEATRLATVLHRCLHCTGMLIFEHYRARRELPLGVWHQLHGYFRMAEDRGVAKTPVEDRLADPGTTTDCSATYAGSLLIDIGSPYSQGLRDLNLIRRCAGLWSPLATVQAAAGQGGTGNHVIELGKDLPLHPLGKEEEAGADCRRLDTTGIAARIRETLAMLRVEMPPAALGLGDETQERAIKVLEALSRPWSMAAAARKFRRFASSGKAKVSVGFEAMHYYISGSEFEQPEVAHIYSRGHFESLFTFRHMVDPSQKPTIRSQVDFPIDEWDVINHSANGFRLARSSVGQKMAHGHLLAVCPHDGGKFLLAQTSWLMQERDGGMIAGLAVLPGIPVAIGVRLTGAQPDGKRLYQRAFLLETVPGVCERGSIVLPHGLFHEERILDVHNGEPWQIRLKSILQQGGDFMRVGFEKV